jgi:uncharacterized protein (TIGR04222 family)
VYVAAIVAVVILVRALRWSARQVPARQPARDLTPYEVAYLSGGPRRVAELILAEQAATGALRVSSDGRVTVADYSALPGSLAGALAYSSRVASAGTSTHVARHRISADPGMSQIRDELRAQSMLMSAARTARVRSVAVLLMVALAGLGIARVIEGALNHRPVSDLVSLMVIGAIFGVFWLRFLGRGDVPSSLGAGYLRRLKAERHGHVPPPPGWGSALAPAALLGVALAGFSAVPDEALRGALIAGIPRTRGDNNGSCNGGGGCGGGGGGGGCGG